jgi:hypothetical protein
MTVHELILSTILHCYKKIQKQKISTKKELKIIQLKDKILDKILEKGGKGAF